MEIRDIEKLAQLARIELKEEEKAKYLKEIGAILGYVDQIKSAVAEKGEERQVPDHRNIMRADQALNRPGDNAAAIIAEFPDRDGDYLKVKKIL